MKSPSSSRTRPLHDPVAALKRSSCRDRARRPRAAISVSMSTTWRRPACTVRAGGVISVLTDKNTKGDSASCAMRFGRSRYPLMQGFHVSEVQVEAACIRRGFHSSHAAKSMNPNSKRLSLEQPVGYEGAARNPRAVRIRQDQTVTELVGVNSRPKSFTIDKDQARER